MTIRIAFRRRFGTLTQVRLRSATLVGNRRKARKSVVNRRKTAPNTGVRARPFFHVAQICMLPIFEGHPWMTQWLVVSEAGLRTG